MNINDNNYNGNNYENNDPYMQNQNQPNYDQNQ